MLDVRKYAPLPTMLTGGKLRVGEEKGGKKKEGER
jgi:hypothetical protein